MSNESLLVRVAGGIAGRVLGAAGAGKKTNAVQDLPARLQENANAVPKEKRPCVYLVDFENTASNIYQMVKGLCPQDEVYVFFTDKSERMSIELIIALKSSKANVSFVRCKNGSPNALDFQLACYLGILVGSRGTSAEYVVVSNDTGYHTMKHVINKQRVKVRFLAKDQAAPQAPKDFGTTFAIFGETKN